jgi:hypothetical protein
MHYINVVWKEKVIIIGQSSQTRLMSPEMLLTVSLKATLWFDHETIYVLTNHGTGLDRRCKVCHRDTFGKVLDVSSEWMVKRQELSVFVERRVLATLRQPIELKVFLAYWAWALPLDTPAAKYPIR